jgi:rhodanese-related sulfurtransferase
VTEWESHCPETTPDDVAARMRAGEAIVLLDVRSPSEYRAYHIPGAVHIPLDQLALRYGELDAALPMVVVCEHGIRSAIAVHFLLQTGFACCATMRHGMSAWRGPVEGMMGFASARDNR